MSIKSYLSILLASATIYIPQIALEAAQLAPNVLFIAVDDLKPMIGAYGDRTILTPQIDRLAARGTTFLNNHCQVAVCGPSRASLLTGLRPDTTQVYDLKTKMRDIHPDILTLPQHFKNNGYETVGMGKIFDPRCVDGRQYQDRPSWSVPFMYHYGKVESAAGFVNTKTIEWFRSQKDANGKAIPEWNIKGIPPVEGSEAVPDNAYSDGAMAEAAVEWIDKLAGADKPYFLAVGFHKPHLPFVAPKKYWDLYERDQFNVAAYQTAPAGTPEFTLQPGYEIRGKYDVPRQGTFPDDLQLELIHGYHACVSYIDAQIGKLLDALEASGEADNTIIVLWGDHGWHLGDHSMWCKHSVYEQATRSPLILVAPEQQQRGSFVQSPTEFTDLFPTLCDLAGLEHPEVLEGISLSSLLDEPEGRVRNVAMSQYARKAGRHDLVGYSFRSHRFRYTEWRIATGPGKKGDGPVYARELYDYVLDPLETRNLIEDLSNSRQLKQMEFEAKTLLEANGIMTVR
ncbi:sulfatase [Coraliomargarita algicola]|uniref:Sulfatase n=1 Tax=Coraliomargarita algicola TaxID=3092156 RepID=A0ABZ0RI26_9BACT|nr:sulfatase [Coraliomargarita sp. J2-16]WPJ95172.1 sulfatase [Coraliomargarita sp. J2-16]